MRNSKQSYLVTFLCVLLGSLTGAAIGSLLGEALALREAEVRLSIDAASATQALESYSADTRKSLAVMNASHYTFCSEAELAYFRRLMYQSTFLREAGRMRDGRVVCSAAVGNAAVSRAPAVAGVAQPDGVKLYWDVPAFRLENESMVAVQSGQSYVVTDFRIRGEGMPAPIHLDVHMRRADWNASYPARDSTSGASSGPAAQFSSDGEATIGDSLFATRCSGQYQTCATASLSIADALRIERNSIFTVMLLSAFAGSALGLLWNFVCRRHGSMERQLRRALAKDKLQVAYQPVVDVASRRIVGAEALARWNDVDGRPVSPGVFVHIAEERGFVGQITRRVLERALQDLSAVIRSRPDFRVSVNVAAADLSDAAFLPMLERALARFAVPRRNLVIELTETCAAQRDTAIATIQKLRQAGHEVHIDDFGTGYSSLSYLSDLAVDAIKIDRAFTLAIGTDSVTVAILPQIMAMAEALSLQLIVEGIETPEQAAYFMNTGVSIRAQGWLFGRPVPIEEFVCALGPLENPRVDLALLDDETEFALPAGAV